ncbi:MAG: hypothetical protein ABI758_05225 [Candidatus Woesebacteria bacterium]
MGEVIDSDSDADALRTRSLLGKAEKAREISLFRVTDEGMK